MKQYSTGDAAWRDRMLVDGRTAGQIYDALMELGNRPTREQVADVIGNKGWSFVTCDGCGDQVAEVVRIGDPADCEPTPKQYCSVCISEAMQLFQVESK